jgi:hypothetical protein
MPTKLIDHQPERLFHASLYTITPSTCQHHLTIIHDFAILTRNTCKHRFIAGMPIYRARLLLANDHRSYNAARFRVGFGAIVPLAQ